MAPNASKTLSAAELQKLEHDFSNDPLSQAYRPLAEAYLAMGRYMEAMVVCKRGAKSHPSSADPRVLLARVYAEQGRDKKALEELAGALQTAPSDKGALRLLGALQLKAGEESTGKANLLKAYDVDPKDEETLALMNQYRVAPPVVQPPPPPPPSVPPPAVAQPAAGGPPPLGPKLVQGSNTGGFSRATRGAAGRASRIHMAAASPAGATSASVPAAGPPAAPPVPEAAEAPVPRAPQAPQAQRRSGVLKAAAPRPYEGSDSQFDLGGVSSETSLPRNVTQRSQLQKLIFIGLIFVVPLVAGAYFGIGQWRARVTREVKKALKKAAEEIRSDSFESYKRACVEAEFALDKDSGNALAHSYLAYAYTVRWGEHERDDAMKKQAQEHLDEAKSRDEDLPYLYAAQALFKFYGGKGSEALRDIEARIEKAEAKDRRVALFYLTQGLLAMAQGDLERAREALDKAQSSTPDDPRVYVALGQLSRRRGNDAAALQAFNSALRFTLNSHPEALLGTALLILDQESPGKGYITAAKYLKTMLEPGSGVSPRQLAQAHFAQALLVSRVAADLPRFESKEFQKSLEDGTGVSADAGKARAEISRQEAAGLQLDRANPELNLVRAKRLYWEEKYDDAASEVQKAIDQNATMAHYHVDLAKVWMKREGNEPKAEAALRKALSLVPNSPQLLALLGKVQYRQKKVDEARETLERAVADVKTKNPDARYALGRLYLDDKKDADKAVVQLERAAQEYTADPSMAAEAYTAQGDALELKGDREKARSAYEKALNADKEIEGAHCRLATLLSKSADAKDRERMKQVASEYVKSFPKGVCAGDLQRLAAGGG